jgi:outer membrane protein TolC
MKQESKTESKTVKDAYDAYFAADDAYHAARKQAVESKKIADAAWAAFQTAWEDLQKVVPTLQEE